MFSVSGVPSSCAAVSELLPTVTDGNYWIQILPGEFAMLYCHDMGNSNQEYIVLVAGESTNYAQNYLGDYTRDAEMYFSKVRLNMTVSIILVYMMYLPISQCYLKKGKCYLV